MPGDGLGDTIRAVPGDEIATLPPKVELWPIRRQESMASCLGEATLVPCPS